MGVYALKPMPQHTLNNATTDELLDMYYQRTGSLSNNQKDALLEAYYNKLKEQADLISQYEQYCDLDEEEG